MLLPNFDPATATASLILLNTHLNITINSMPALCLDGLVMQLMRSIRQASILGQAACKTFLQAARRTCISHAGMPACSKCACDQCST